MKGSFRSDRDEEEHKAAKTEKLWLIIYTDMISNLVIFFLMLYCLTWLNEDEKKIAAASFKEAFAGERKAVENVMTEIEKGLEKDRNVEGKLKEEFANNIEVSEKRITIILPSPVLFDSGSAELKPSTKNTLKEIADIVKSISNKIIVEGHTDDIPISGRYASNWELSSARAFSVIKYFIEECAVEPARLSSIGHGEFKPKFPNDNAEHRSKNRRIEINIIKANT
ncbi:MAG: flagellar motor protein MotB [Endomicrobiales bacterium]|nr:flagellar motor protein MotB [Endomicrobiales bacterium]